MDVDRERSSMDVDTNGEPSVDADNWFAPPRTHDHLAPSVASSSMTVMHLQVLGSTFSTCLHCIKKSEKITTTEIKTI